jgi:hypothetical protein
MATALPSPSSVRHRWGVRSTSQTSTPSSASSTSSNWSLAASDWQSHAQKADSLSTAPATSSNTQSSILLRLPPEIVIHHLLPHLNYPSLLSLRLSHPYFYHSPLLYPARAPAIRLRVAWLLDRGAGGNVLVPTKSGSLNVGTDEGFLANPQVQELLRRERRHVDCDRGRAGCRVVLGVTCGGPKKGGRLDWIRARRRTGDWWRMEWAWVAVSVLVALVAVVLYVLRTNVTRS